MKKRILIALGVLVLAAGIGAGGWYYYTHHAGAAGGSDVVYVTANGEVYHLYSDCSYLVSSIKNCKGTEIADK